MSILSHTLASFSAVVLVSWIGSLLPDRVITDVFVCPLLKLVSLFEIFILALFPVASFGEFNVLSKSDTKSKGSAGLSFGLDV